MIPKDKSRASEWINEKSKSLTNHLLIQALCIHNCLCGVIFKHDYKLEWYVNVCRLCIYLVQLSNYHKKVYFRNLIRDSISNLYLKIIYLQLHLFFTKDYFSQNAYSQIYFFSNRVLAVKLCTRAHECTQLFNPSIIGSAEKRGTAHQRSKVSLNEHSPYTEI